MIKPFFLALFFAALNGCSYLGTVVQQADYSLQQMAAPEQRVYKHMLNRETFFVFGKIELGQKRNDEAIAVIAVSDQFRKSEVVDVNHAVRPDSYYGLNLPAGEYRLLVVSDLDRNGFYEQSEILGSRALSLNSSRVPDKVLGGYDLSFAVPPEIKGESFQIAVRKTPPRNESFFFPKGTLRSLDDPIFAPEMAAMGLYEPAAFLEAAPMMFYAIEEDVGYKIPVVFVHGIGGSVRDFAKIVASLDRTRYRPWFFYYPSGGDLKQLGAMFYKIFLSGKTIPLWDMPLVIVAHSMGGLVVREALNLQTGANGENRVQRLITIASPLRGHSSARDAGNAPVVIPSWRDLNPESQFIAGLHRRALPQSLQYHLFFAYGDDRAIKLGVNSDGVIPLSSQLSPPAQKEAKAQHGFDDTHTGVVQNLAVIQEIMKIIADVKTPFPEPFMQVFKKGGFNAALGPHYTPLEAYFIRNVGHFMEAMATGQLTPIHPSQEHFIQAARGEAAAESEIETAWIKFSQEFPDRRALPQQTPAEKSEIRW